MTATLTYPTLSAPVPVISPTPVAWNSLPGRAVLTRPGSAAYGDQAIRAGRVRSWTFGLTVDEHRAAMALNLAGDELHPDMTPVQIAAAILTVHDQGRDRFVWAGAFAMRDADRRAVTGQRATRAQLREYCGLWPDPDRTALCRLLAARLIESVTS
jgi:hypothetical protein